MLVNKNKNIIKTINLVIKLLLTREEMLNMNKKKYYIICYVISLYN